MTDQAGRPVDIKAEIEALNSDVDGMLADQAAEGADSDIEVDDLAVDVAGTIEDEAAGESTDTEKA